MSSCAQELCVYWGGLGNVCNCALFEIPRRCTGCYESFSGAWCDNCDQWPCECLGDSDE